MSVGWHYFLPNLLTAFLILKTIFITFQFYFGNVHFPLFHSRQILETEKIFRLPSVSGNESWQNSELFELFYRRNFSTNWKNVNFRIYCDVLRKLSKFFNARLFTTSRNLSKILTELLLSIHFCSVRRSASGVCNRSEIPSIYLFRFKSQYFLIWKICRPKKYQKIRFKSCSCYKNARIITSQFVYVKPKCPKCWEFSESDQNRKFGKFIELGNKRKVKDQMIIEEFKNWKV